MDKEIKVLNKLCLGTVQFGMKYGINNQMGQPSEEACFTILDTALESGIDVIDTARAYGTAEIVVGNYLEYRKCHHKVEIISKLRPNVIEPNEKDVYSVIRRELEESLKRLHVSQLNGYLLHTPEYIYDERIVESLFRLKEEEMVQNIGVSIYNMAEGYEAIKRRVDYVQLPFSVLDQRGSQSGFMKEAKKEGVTVFARSAFLQGLFMMGLDRIPKHLEYAKPYLIRLEELIEQYEGSKVEFLLQFVKCVKEIDFLVFGVDSRGQLCEDIAAFECDMPLERRLLSLLQEAYSQVEDSVIMPSLWSNGRKAE